MSFTTINPATGEVVATFEAMSDVEIEAALGSCQAAFESWRETELEFWSAILECSREGKNVDKCTFADNRIEFGYIVQGESTAKVYELPADFWLEVGYNKLSGYQVNAGGFETWGSGPGKEVLSAFGLLQFADMAEVYPVDKSILSKDVDYLLGQRDGKGGFSNTGESAHGYGSAPKPILDGFITYALAKTGYVSKLDKEIAQQAETARQTKDPYVLALAARVLHAAEHRGAEDARKRLAAMQAEDGS